MQADRLATLGLAPLRRAGVVPSKPAIPILMYHSISHDPEVGVRPYYRVTTSPERFKDQMRWLHGRGYSTVDIPEALSRLRDGAGGVERSVVLTFDDGFRDFSTHAAPVLEEFGFTATMFLPTGFIGDTRSSFKGRECLTWAEVRELHGRGVSFGAHTVNHPELYRMPWEEVRRELADSRACIQDELQVPVSAFAYPYAFPQEDGEFVRRLRGELMEQGYKRAVTTVIGRANASSDPLSLTRLPVNESDDEPLFSSKVDGAYDWVGGFQRSVRRAKKLVRRRGDASG
jgi:peptidoglycan/xylan/chitin deacetylase (PgdA/CDA1 family)